MRVKNSEARSVSYPGGKSGAGVYQTIINQIPPHEIYIEPFLGSGAILRKKAAAICSIGVDSDRNVIEAFLEDPIPGLTLHHDDAIHFLRIYRWTGREFVYCDPPYLMETRSSKKRIYCHEFSTPAQHLELLTILKAMPASIAISGYRSCLYDDILRKWRVITYRSMTRGGTVATEYLWMNYPEPAVLHDYRYLGGSFRERERIKRRQHRWKSRLEKMNHLERAALLMAIKDLGPITPNLALDPATSKLALRSSWILSPDKSIGARNPITQLGDGRPAKRLNPGEGITIDRGKGLFLYDRSD